MHAFVSDTAPILVAHSYYLRHDTKQVAKMKPYPPLATLLAAAALRERGFTVRCFDAMLADGVEEFQAVLDEVLPSLVALVEDNFNFLTKMCTLAMREDAFKMIGAARAGGARVVVNGSDACDHPELYLAAGADAVMLGEPESTLLDIAARWRRTPHASLGEVSGLVLHTNGGRPALARTGTRPSIENLDALPFPAWDLIDAGRYRRAWTAAHGRLSWNMATSRGCPYHCNWCAKPIFGTRYAQRTPANVVDELVRLRDTVAPDHIWFADDIFGLTTRWLDAFSREVVSRDVRTPFLMQSRANLMKPRVVAALAEAGAEEVWLGVESGSQRILDAMEKGTTIAQIREATRALKAHGIRTGWFLQLGYRSEAWSDILATRDLVREEQPDDIGVSVSYPLPGTSFYDQVREELGPDTNWRDSDDLAMLFAGTYVTEFYRQVRDLLHHEVRTGQSLDARWSELHTVEAEFRNHRRTSSST